jgi:hypothetical protein
MDPSDSTLAALHAAGLPEQLCLTWCQSGDLEEVARKFGADLPSGIWATPEDIEDLEEETPGELLQLSLTDGWVIALEPSGFQGVRTEVLGPLSADGRALSIFWNVELDSSVRYAADGQIVTSFNLVDVERRTGTDPAALDEVLREVALHGGLPVRERKARALALGEKISGRPLTPHWLRSPQLVFTIKDPLPDLPVPPAYLDPRSPFLDEPEFARILARPTPDAAPAIAKMAASVAASVAALEVGLVEEILGMLEDGERFPGQRESIQAQLAEHADETWQRARKLRSGSARDKADEALELEVASHAARVLTAALLPDPLEGASAAVSQGVALRLPPLDHGRMRVLYNVVRRIEYDLRHP